MSATSSILVENKHWYPMRTGVKYSDNRTSTLAYKEIGMFSIPVIGNLIAALGKIGISKTNRYSEDVKIYMKTEVLKCERIGALILLITGIALLALFPKFGQNFAIAGGTLSGIGLLEVAYLSHQIKKNNELRKPRERLESV